MKFTKLLSVLLVLLFIAMLVGAFPGVADAQVLLRRQAVVVGGGGATVVRTGPLGLRQNVTVVNGGVQQVQIQRVQQIAPIQRIVAKRQNVLLVQAPAYSVQQVQQVRVQRVVQQVQYQPVVQQIVQPVVQQVQYQPVQVQQVQQVQQYVPVQQLQVQQYVAPVRQRLLVTDNCH